MSSDGSRADGRARAWERWVRRTRLTRIAIAAAAYLVYVYVNGGRAAGLDYFVPLAEAFLDGRLDVAAEPFLNELVPIAGTSRGYVVYPPMPAIVLLPAVAIAGPGLDQAGVSLLLGALNVYLASGVLVRLGLRLETWVTLTLVFGFGSIVWYSAQAGTSWHFAHVCALLFMLLAIRGTQVGWPLWAIGAVYGAAGLSRLPMFLAAPYFAAYLAHVNAADGRRSRPFGWVRPAGRVVRPGAVRLGAFVRDGLVFSIGPILMLAAFFAYNAARFGSPTEAGYELIPGLLDEHQYRFGFFSTVNIPRNLYAMLLTPPRLVEHPPFVQPPLLGGMSLLLTTPLFLWAIRARSGTPFVIGCWAALVAILVPVLLHADPGGAQFGYRYAQDFYPFLLLLTAHGVGRRLSFEATVAAGVGFVVNVWGMWATNIGWFA